MKIIEIKMIYIDPSTLLRELKVAGINDETAKILTEIVMERKNKVTHTTLIKKIKGLETKVSQWIFLSLVLQLCLIGIVVFTLQK
jgi:hypothetical protein